MSVHARDNEASELDLLRQRVAGLESECERWRNAHREVEEQLRTLIEYAPEAIVLLDAQTGRFVNVNSNAERLFGLPREQLLQAGPFDFSPRYQPDGPSEEIGRRHISEALRGETPVFEWWHCNAQGARFPCEVRLVRIPWGNSDVVRGSILDITQRKQLQLCNHGRSEVLEKIARGASLAEVLDDLARTSEQLLPGMLASILILDSDTQCLRLGAAPNLPEFYNRAVDGIPIGPAAGSCGTAAFTAKRVVVRDVQDHPYWIDYRDLADRAGLRSCWSEPIMSLSGVVLGTFAMYYREPREPMHVEIQVIDIASQLASLAIEHDQTQRTLRTMNETLERTVAERTKELSASNQKLRKTQADLRLAAVAFQTHDSILITDREGRILRINESFTRLTGYSADEVLGKTPRILKSGRHERDFYRQMWTAIRTKGYWQGEIWNRRKSGEIYPQRLTITCVQDAEGNTTHYVADGQDLTEEKRGEAARTALGVARDVQRGLFPTAAPVLSGFDIAGAVTPAEHVSGDYFDYLPLSQDTVAVVVADVSGHGLGPALLMAQNQAFLRALAKAARDPGEILTNVNRLSQLGEDGRFATLFLGCLNVAHRTFLYAGAGHQGHLLRRDGIVRTLKSTSCPLGAVENEPIASAPVIHLQAGDLIVIPTDGVTEARNLDGDLFGCDRALQVALDNAERPACELVTRIFQAARKFVQGQPQHDDMTAVIIKVQEAADGD